jgi:GTPase SAR1 family protein
MKRYQTTLHAFTESNIYEERVIARCSANLTPIIDELHENDDFQDLPIVLLPNNIELHITLLESLKPHITIELLQEIY